MVCLCDEQVRAAPARSVRIGTCVVSFGCGCTSRAGSSSGLLYQLCPSLLIRCDQLPCLGLPLVWNEWGHSCNGKSMSEFLG